jgi:hypothetical protein
MHKGECARGVCNESGVRRLLPQNSRFILLQSIVVLRPSEERRGTLKYSEEVV